jgi:hypothetical protein
LLDEKAYCELPEEKEKLPPPTLELHDGPFMS